ncbi:MAG: hypothetical protein U0Q16_16930 [Bryobacteraceae bacterium]
MSAAATTSPITVDSIFQTLCAELHPSSETDRMLLRTAANAQFRLQLAQAQLLEILTNDGYTDEYFRIQRSEAKDRACFLACLNTFYKSETRRTRIDDRNARKLSAILDRHVTPATPPPPPPAPEPPPAEPDACETLETPPAQQPPAAEAVTQAPETGISQTMDRLTQALSELSAKLGAQTS